MSPAKWQPLGPCSPGAIIPTCEVWLGDVGCLGRKYVGYLWMLPRTNMFALFYLPDAYEGKAPNTFSVAISQYLTLVLEGCAGSFLWRVSLGLCTLSPTVHMRVRGCKGWCGTQAALGCLLCCRSRERAASSMGKLAVKIRFLWQVTAEQIQAGATYS